MPADTFRTSRLPHIGRGFISPLMREVLADSKAGRQIADHLADKNPEGIIRLGDKTYRLTSTSNIR